MSAPIAYPYPKLKHCAIEIFFDNGMFPRMSPGDDQAAGSHAVAAMVAKHGSAAVKAVEDELAKFNDDELLLICVDPENRPPISQACDSMLDDIFDDGQEPRS